MTNAVLLPVLLGPQKWVEVYEPTNNFKVHFAWDIMMGEANDGPALNLEWFFQTVKCRSCTFNCTLNKNNVVGSNKFQ